MFDALIKVGGSVCHGRHIKEYAPQWAALAGRYRLLFLAGGGLFADQVRALDQHLDLSDAPLIGWPSPPWNRMVISWLI